MAIYHIFIGDDGGADLLRGSVHREVQLAPCPTLIRPMHTDLPFSFAIDFEPGGINHQMADLLRRSQSEFQRARTSGKSRVMRCWQSDLHQSEHG